jgi:putative heme-binding domain-containing protein
LANPILSCIQTIRAERSEDQPSVVALTRTADMVISEDKNFRPIAIHFGPDGCLYVVDWYNPIISHNEVPRNHPDRDKTHSRIWRIRHTSQEYSAPRDVTAVADADLPALLDAPSTWESRAAWHQIADRQAQSLSTELERMATDDGIRTPARVLALWCLEDLGHVRLAVLKPLFRSAEPALRREAARLCAALDSESLNWEAVLGWARAETDPRVRFAAIEALGSMEALGAGGVNLLLGMVRDADEVEGTPLAASDRAFERSLVRVALEGHVDALATLLDGDTDVANPMRCLAALCLGGRDGAERLGQEITRAGRSPNAEEYGLLSQHAESEILRNTILTWWREPATRLSGLRMVIDNADRWNVDALRPALTVALRELVRSEPGAESWDLMLRGAQALRLGELEPDVIELLHQGTYDPLACLQALSEMGSQDPFIFYDWAQASVPASQARTVAATALARISTDEAFELALELWPYLERTTKREVLAALITQRAGAVRTLAALGRGDLPVDALSERVLDRMQQHLGQGAELDSLRADLSQRQTPVLTFGGAGADFLDSNLKISGPFTVEAWVRPEEGISNADGLLCQPGRFDFNFAVGQPRLWCGPEIGDVITSKKKLQPDEWTHIALTRDAEGLLCLYIQGELDQTSTRATQPEFEELDVARTTPGGGMSGNVAGFRLWSSARTAQQIADGLGLRMEADDHPELTAVIPTRSTLSSLGAFGTLISDGPPTLTAEEARAQSEAFAQIRTLARANGDSSRGKELFAQHCLACHRVGGEGTDIGPVLDGAGAKGIEGLLRSIVTPNAGVESGYRTLVVETVEGELLEGFLAGEDADSIVLRRKDRADLKLPRGEILSMRFDSLSLMPEALLDPLEPEQITDLFSYLIGL